MRVLAFFLQCLLAIAGYVLAVVAVGVFAGLAADRVVGSDVIVAFHADGFVATGMPPAVAIGIAAGLAAGAVGFLPAAAAIVFAEALGVRSLFFYLSVAILVAVLIASPVDPFAAPVPGVEPFPFLIGCGTVAGAVYWLVAGRRAGRWRTAGANGPTGGGPDGAALPGPRGGA